MNSVYECVTISVTKAVVYAIRSVGMYSSLLFEKRGTFIYLNNDAFNTITTAAATVDYTTTTTTTH